MTISIQNTIVNSIKTTLESITISNGFLSNVSSVKRGIRTVEDFEGSMPGIALWKNRNEREDSYQFGSESNLHMRIWGFVECDSMQDDYDPLDKFVADCEKVLMSEDYNPNYYKNTFIGDTVFFEGGAEMNFGIFEMSFYVSYFYDHTTV
jgi:hypothetical protein